MKRQKHRCPRLCLAKAECDGCFNGTIFFRANAVWLLYEGDTEARMWFGMN